MTTSVKDQFIQNLINTLNNENENRINNNRNPLDVCYLVSAIDQQIENYKEFLDDITEHTYVIDDYKEDWYNGYTNGEIQILIEKPNDEEKYEYINNYCNHKYYIKFLQDERPYGECQCSPEDENYNDKYGCCGENCDFSAPAFRLIKETNLGYSCWEYSEKEYWKYKEQFETNEQNKNVKVERFILEQQKNELKDKIAELQEELNRLETETQEYGNLKLVR